MLRLGVAPRRHFGGGEDPEQGIARFEGICKCNDVGLGCGSLEFLRKLATRLSVSEFVPISDSIEYRLVKKTLLSLRIFSDVLDESSILSLVFMGKQRGQRAVTKST